MIDYDNTTVRRQDRLLPRAEAEILLREGEYGVLSMTDDSGHSAPMAYGIPVSYVWDGHAAIYLHCAPSGRKLSCIERHPQVSFCVVGRTQALPSRFTTAYESVVLDCRARTGLPEHERHRALELLISKYSPHCKAVGLRYAEASFHRTEVVRLDILAASGKCKRAKIE